MLHDLGRASGLGFSLQEFGESFSGGPQHKHTSILKKVDKEDPHVFESPVWELGFRLPRLGSDSGTLSHHPSSLGGFKIQGCYHRVVRSFIGL